MTTIKDQISNDLKDAMRSKDKNKLEALRLMMAAVKQIEVDERIQVDDARMLAILDKLAKQRKESLAQFQAAGRADLVAQEQFELDIINQYLPEPISDAELEMLVSEAINDLGAEKISDMGKVMAQLKPRLQGRADMSKVSAMIKAKLS
ncbi:MULTISPECIES: GatB/YqeY domain-containing protein [Legionella]|uniref:GatB/YqeY domain-containing protein n=1 Tax=Legionella septentrionalis TaxID=2498109 RepID=A0A3S0WT14_9GAMM|nr:MULTISPECIES: GatB/YqeY domain-containing protein [Legionella]MCP0914035.1 GatB/YqeY domain-containing protein [Legionella sp. 27cVA30]RUQ90802.1 GatB/YqeY domain-containing protein [Legionella septentrionalis]RUQ93366.1 GatB/YqeY domain-containing protein [Legionella septentrionalis]RUR09210.1 GatB/YqeY domain-containing protein [Legionella septentrionalis]RUR13928.1 GatB/YqeY domain-containing protein [Legionella septentrionalis]